MVQTSFRHKAAAGLDVYLNPKPATRDQAFDNLRTICRTTESAHRRGKYPPFKPSVQINRCLGWTQFKGSDINGHLARIRARCFLDLKDDETYYAIIYRYMSDEANLDADKIISALDFFNVIGFMNVTFKPDNWLGSGVLADMSDLISPFSMWWHPREYEGNQEASRRRVEFIAEQGGLVKPFYFSEVPAQFRKPLVFKLAERVDSASDTEADE